MIKKIAAAEQTAAKTVAEFDWSQLAFGSKKPLRELKAVFIAAPRELSAARFTQLVKQYLPGGNIVLGLAKEQYIDGFDGQPQFCTLQQTTVQKIIGKVNGSRTPHKIYLLHYFQRELPHILEKISFRKVVLVNGSWHYSFHVRPEYYVLANSRTDYELVSPFASEDEAKQYAAASAAEYPLPNANKTYSAAELLDLAQSTARLSFDHTFQMGAVLAKKAGDNGQYVPLVCAFNKVVPYQTYAMHHGASREQHFTSPNDLSYYDTVHGEIELLLRAAKQKIDLRGTTLFINLLPCPQCSRILSETDITEIMYRLDHSSGYAHSMLQAAGKVVQLAA